MFRSNTIRYFNRILCVIPQSLNRTIMDFINMMCVSDEQRIRILSQPQQSQFIEADKFTCRESTRSYHHI